MIGNGTKKARNSLVVMFFRKKYVNKIINKESDGYDRFGEPNFRKANVDNPNLEWENVYQKNMMKLAIITLFYVFANDDDKISRKELKKVKNFCREREHILTKEDIIEMNQFSINDITASDLFNYMLAHDYGESIFLEAIDEIKDIT